MSITVTEGISHGTHHGGRGILSTHLRRAFGSPSLSVSLLGHRGSAGPLSASGLSPSQGGRVLALPPGSASVSGSKTEYFDYILSNLMGSGSKTNAKTVRLGYLGKTVAQGVYHPETQWPTKDANAFMSKYLNLVPMQEAKLNADGESVFIPSDESSFLPCYGEYCGSKINLGRKSTKYFYNL